MRITRIEMSDFRGVKGPEPFAIDLGPEGKNLLLYGENGSGKSTIALALDRVVRRPKRMAATDANRLRAPESEAAVHARLHFTDGTQFTYANPRHAGEKETKRTLDDAVLRYGFLDYRILTQCGIHAGSARDALYRLVVGEILADHQVTLAGVGQSVTKAWAGVKKGKPKPTRRHESVVKVYRNMIHEFNAQLAAAVGGVETTVRELLQCFAKQKIQLRLQYEPAKYTEDGSLVQANVVPHVEFGSDSHTDFSDWLNEARLSCLALCLHLASVKKRDIAPAGNLDPLRVLCLDDVLIGLDMSNRREKGVCL